MPRLDSARSDTLHILRALRHEEPQKGNHWAYDMWRGHEECLVYYGLVVTHEWRIVRGLRDKYWGEFGALAAEYGMLRTPDMVKEDNPVQMVYPPWLGEDWIMRSHRSALIRKMPHHYYPQFGDTPDNMPMLWPFWTEDSEKYKLIVCRSDIGRLETGERVLPRQIELLDKLTGEVRITE
jgi:hypothetical protein